MFGHRCARRELPIVAVGLSVLVLLLVGVTAGDAASPKVVTFFSINSLTGASAFYGTGAIKEEQLLATQINSKGGFTDTCGNRYTIKLTTWDDAGTAAQAVAGMQRAGGDSSVLGVLGSTPDPAWLAELPLAGQLRLPLVIPSGGTSSVARKDWNPYAFIIYAPAASTFSAALTKLRKAVHFTRVGLLYDNTEPGSISDAKLWQQDARKLGYQVVTAQTFQGTDTNSLAQLTKIRAAKPDFLVLDGAPGAIALQYNEAKQLGIRVPAYTVSGGAQGAAMWKLTHGATKNSYFFAPGAVASNVKLHDPAAATLYQKATGLLPNIYQVAGWDALNIAIKAVKRSCTSTDRAKFQHALATTTNFPLAASGAITWRNPPDGVNKTPTVVVAEVTGANTFKLLP